MKKAIFQISKCVMVGVLVSLVFVLILAFVSYLAGWTESILKPIIQILKILSIVLGTLSFVREDKGLIKGAIIGLLITVATFFLYGAIGGKIFFSFYTLLEVLLSVFAGAVAGVFAINIKKNG